MGSSLSHNLHLESPGQTPPFDDICKHALDSSLHPHSDENPSTTDPHEHVLQNNLLVNCPIDHECEAIQLRVIVASRELAGSLFGTLKESLDRHIPLKCLLEQPAKLCSEEALLHEVQICLAHHTDAKPNLHFPDRYAIQLHTPRLFGKAPTQSLITRFFSPVSTLVDFTNK